jgi:hypothetical protein
MEATLLRNYQEHTPLLWIYVRGLMRRRTGLQKNEQLPVLKLEQARVQTDKKHLGKYLKACRLSPGPSLPLLYPLMVTFPLHMRILTHPAFPLKYVNMLQLRNQVVQHRSIGIDECMDVSCEILSRRNVMKGLEFEMYTVFSSDGEILWENINTYFFTGSYGEPSMALPRISFEPVSQDAQAMTWITPAKGGFRFALISGDYNGIHYLAPYARMFGFKRDFAHGQCSVLQCVEHLPEISVDNTVRIDVALKGPVYYSSEVVMKYNPCPKGYRFDLYCGDMKRPCILGSIRNIDQGSGLISDP